MSAAVFRKTLRDAWVVLALSVAAILGFELLFIQAMDLVLQDIANYLSRVPPFARRLMSVLGADLADHVTPTGLMSVGLGHPVVHTILWAYSIAFATRVLAAEFQRGTADLLMTLPVRRSAIYLALTAAWLLSGALLCAALWAGAWLGQHAFGKGPFNLRILALIAVNLFALYLAVGAVSFAVSAAFSRRGRAVGVIVALLVASFALNFLAAFWEPARSVAFVGVLNYYQPLSVIIADAWPAHDLAVLSAVALVGWTVGLVVFLRRDVPAV